MIKLGDTVGLGFPTILHCKMASVPSVNRNPFKGVCIRGAPPKPRESIDASSASVSLSLRPQG